MPRVFSVIKIKDRNLNTIIDGIRLLADPYEKQVAHITIRGPYSQKYNIDDINKSIKDTKVNVKGIGTFFETSRQNTIFFKCDSPYLQTVWKKSDYPFNPHLTLYDGNSREFAHKLLLILQRHSFNFAFNVDGLEYINSVPKQSNANIALEYDWKQLSYYLKEEITYADVVSLSVEDRLSRIEKLVHYFNDWDGINSYPSPINDILNKLELTKENGLFFYSDFESWEKRFPYRIVRAIKEIRPYAFFSLFKNEELNRHEHPQPFNQPLILFFDNPSEKQEKTIHRQVFSFGQAPIVFIDRINSLEIYNGFVFENKEKNDRLLKIGDGQQAFDFSFKNLLSGHAWEKNYKKSFHNIKKVDDYLLENLSQTREILIDTFSLKPSIVNSLIGRLLFIRYLIDREVEFKKEKGNNEDYFPGIDRQARNRVFLDFVRTPDKLYSFFKYLEDKLNGDLFPVTKEEKDVIDTTHLEVLYHLFNGEKLFKDSHHQYIVQNSLFDVYDFKIIPIELISNIYEQFMGRKKREENKSFYTPSFLVDYILSKTVTPHLEKNGKSICKVLDPSCGSGIFLIETLRKIIEKHLSNKADNSINNERLWKLVKDNIFGIDIDPDAIEVAIFSLYVTVLDYVEPKVIAKNFKFEKLKNSNFFPQADFFDTKHNFNNVLKTVSFDFILGNPPWGQVDSSEYIQYCKNRESSERVKSEKKINIGISDKQIAQAFLIRVSDFCNENTICALVVTSKVLYNTNAKAWRSYFLTNYTLHEIFELSAVNTKIFNGANWPSAIIFYSHSRKKNKEYDNVVNHISLKPNRFFKYFKTIVIEKYDYKKIQQKYFLETQGGHDWLWKVLLYGNILDFHFINRLKNNYQTVQEIIDNNKLEYGVGLKRKDASKQQNASQLIGKPFLDTGIKDFNRFAAIPSSKWKEDFAAVIPHVVDDKGYPVLFKGPLALIKEGLDSGYRGVAAYCKENIVFTHSVRAIKGNKDDADILKSLVALFNSKLFTYYIFLTGTSTGIDFIRANQIEQFSFPATLDNRYGKIVDSIQDCILSSVNNVFDSNELESIKKMENELEEIVNERYEVIDVEADLISYTEEVSIPLTKATEAARCYRALSNTGDDIDYLKQYADIYINHFERRLFDAGKFIQAEIYSDKDIVGINFMIVDNKPTETIGFKECNNVLEIMNTLYELSFFKVSEELYIQRDVKGFQSNSFYVIKPNEYKCWHKAIARLDLAEFVDAIIKSGAKKQRLSN